MWMGTARDGQKTRIVSKVGLGGPFLDNLEFAERPN
jgi:hypothetical protein